MKADGKNPAPRPPANYGHNTIRHSTTSGSTEIPGTTKTWTAEGDEPKKKIRGKRKPSTAATPTIPDARWASGANTTIATRAWGGRKK